MKPRVLPFNIALMLLVVVALSSCKSYELMHYKGAEIDKAGDLGKSKVYIHSKGHLFMVSGATLDKTNLSGSLSPVTDASEATEIREPSTPHLLKKHQKDVVISTKTDIADSAKSVNLPKKDISEYTRVVVHSHFGQAVADGVVDMIGVAVCVGFIGALVYWVGSTPK